jgi:polyisoprenyl-phosphate glycosyltransferase
MTLQKKLVSIVVPFYNEEASTEIFYKAICSAIASIKEVEFEVVCVDDGSTDKTLELLIDISKLDHRFKVIELSRNFGKEAALTAGLEAASGDAAVPNGFDVVLARRTDRSSDGFLKRKTAELFYRIHNRFSTVTIPENVGDFRLMDRTVLEALRQLPEQQRFMKGLFAWVGFKTFTINYVRQSRCAGVSKFSGWKLWNFALEGITSFSSSPLKFWSYLGGLGALISLLYALFIVVRTLAFGVDLPGYASLLVAIIFFGSVQLISVGMLGEYIGRIYMETKRRPLYIVRRRHGSKF